MHKILLIVAAAAALLSLASCGKRLDLVDDYTISLEVQGHLEDEDSEQALMDYFDENFLESTHIFTYSGDHYSAMLAAEEFFEKSWEQVDRDFILSCINDPEDIVYLLCVMSGQKSKEIVNYVYWDYSLKEQLTAEPAE